jgi:hypothetical protein
MKEGRKEERKEGRKEEIKEDITNGHDGCERTTLTYQNYRLQRTRACTGLVSVSQESPAQNHLVSTYHVLGTLARHQKTQTWLLHQLGGCLCNPK